MNWLGTKVATLVTDLSECLCKALAEQGGGPTCWCGFYPGATPSWEHCGECNSGSCGMGYVRLATAYPFESFPSISEDSGCQKPIAVALVVGALRCMPTLEQDGSLPNEETIMESGLAVIADMGAMREAVACCIKRNQAYTLGAYLPLGPNGGCVGGEWPLAVSLDG